MRKILFFAMAVAISMTSCESGITEEAATSAKTVKVHVSMSGFDIETATRTTTTADTAGVSSIVFAVIDGQGKIIYDTLQSKGSEGFGTVSFELTEGTYTFAAEANKGDRVATIDVSGGKAIATFLTDVAYETFATTQQVTVTAGEGVDVLMILKRITAQLSLATKDNQPEEAKTLQIFVGDTLKAAYDAFSIDIASGTMEGFGVNGHLARKWSRGTSDAGKPTTQNCALFLDSVQQNLPVKIAVLDANGAVIKSHTIASVPFKQNCKTIITGEFYNTPANGSFQFDTNWSEDVNGGW